MRLPGEPAMAPRAHSFIKLGAVLAEMASSIGETSTWLFGPATGFKSGVLMAGDDASEAGWLLFEAVLVALLGLSITEKSQHGE